MYAVKKEMGIRKLCATRVRVVKYNMSLGREVCQEWYWHTCFCNIYKKISRKCQSEK